eukprot:gene39802-53824_t
MLPAFDSRGLLPPFLGSDATNLDRSPYFATMVDFALAFGTTNERKTLIRALIGYRGLMASGGFVSGIQFLDGSFVEDVEATQNRSPADIDVFSFVSMPAAYAGNQQAWQTSGFPFWRDEIVDPVRNKA